VFVGYSRCSGEHPRQAIEKKTTAAGDIAADPDNTDTFTNQSETALMGT
jgi:hypothetical protein